MPVVLALACVSCAHGQWIESVEPAQTFTTTCTGGVVPFAAGRAEDVVLAEGHKRGWELQGDGRLSELLDAILSFTAMHGKMPRRRLVDAMARRMGITDELSKVGMFAASSMEEGVAKLLDNGPRNTRYNRYGIAKFQMGRAFSFGVIFASRPIELEPVPRHVAVGETVRVAGKLTAANAKAIGYVTPPDGAARQLGRSLGPSFDFKLKTAVPGVYRLEVMADLGAGPTIAAILPVTAGLPGEVTVNASTLENDVTANARPEAIAARVFELLNDARREAGAADLAIDPSLTALARSHAEDMNQNHYFAHISPTLGGPGERAKRANLHISTLGENIALSTSANAAHDGLMDSPGHRSAILNRTYNRVGVAVVKSSEPGSQLIYVVQEFALVPTPQPATH